MSPASQNRARLMEADFVLGPDLGGQGPPANGRGEVPLGGVGPLGGLPVVGDAGNGVSVTPALLLCLRELVFVSVCF